jgi:hypothetical protein
MTKAILTTFAAQRPIKSISKMNKFFTQVLLACVFLSAGITNAQVIKSKDGKVLGDQKDIVKACVEAAENEVVNLNNVQIKLEDYCNCMATGVLPNLTLKEVETAIANNSFQQLLLREDNIAIFQKCAESNVKIDSAFVYTEAYDNAQTRPYFVKLCVQEMFSEPGIEDFVSEAQATQICNCAADKIVELGFNYGQITNMSDAASPEFEAVILGCIPKELIDKINAEK